MWFKPVDCFQDKSYVFLIYRGVIYAAEYTYRRKDSRVFDGVSLCYFPGIVFPVA